MSPETMVEDSESPCASRHAEENGLTRRSLFASLLGMGGAVIGAVVGLPVFRSLFYPVYAEEEHPQWSDVGDIKDFGEAGTPVVKTVAVTRRDGWRDVVSHHSVFVNRSADGAFQVLSSVCPHLGCSVAWHEDQSKFICPCHGGQFSADGKRISGPPPRGLDSLESQVHEGKLQVHFAFFRSNLPGQKRSS